MRSLEKRTGNGKNSARKEAGHRKQWLLLLSDQNKETSNGTQHTQRLDGNDDSHSVTALNPLSRHFDSPDLFLSDTFTARSLCVCVFHSSSRSNTDTCSGNTIGRVYVRQKVDSQSEQSGGKQRKESKESDV
jgi:hypothetical protein